MRGVEQVGEQAGVHARVQRLDPAAEDLGETGDVLDRGDRHPAAAIRAAVDPVETISTPASCSPRASSSSPVLSYTRDQCAPHRTPAVALLGRLAHGTLTFLLGDGPPVAGHPADDVDEQLALDHLDALVQRRLVVAVEHLDRPLRDDRPGVDSGVHEDHVAPVTLTPCASASRTPCMPGNAGSRAGWVLTVPAPELVEEAGAEQLA